MHTGGPRCAQHPNPRPERFPSRLLRLGAAPHARGTRPETGPAAANEGRWKGDHCENERDWPEALAVLGFSVPVSLLGTALFTTGVVSRRMSAHAQAMRELDELAEGAAKRSTT
ncbi:hypothetical protein ABZ154_19905 [Streptomyces sp. NPDC006261]|uniref:hypothetical protein n=1 Tax=Streptomyces sp. NPDC006261 TaxID=3156739 RepID=UPI0033B5157E